MDGLTECLLMNILIRLPARYAQRCKSVCKRWNFLISDPHFISQFIRHNKPPSSSLSPPLLHLLPSPIIRYFDERGDCAVTSNKEEERVFKCRQHLLSFLPCLNPNFLDYNWLQPCIVASSGGLLLCSGVLFTDSGFSSFYYVCNPVTMNWVQIPPPPWRGDNEACIGFICEPYSNNHHHHHHHNNNSREKEEEEESSVFNSQYRFIVVRIEVPFGTFDEFPIKIFSSETGEWSVTSVLCPMELNRNYPLTSPVVYNGILHFLFPSSAIFAYHPFNRCTHDPFHFLRVPFNCAMHLGISRGYLALFLDPTEDGIAWEVLELEDYYTCTYGAPHYVYTNLPSAKPPRSNTSHRHLKMIELFGTLYLVQYPEFIAFPLELPSLPTPVPTFPRNALP